MILELHNFKCYDDIKIQLPDTGIVLLKGESGTGKSTILNSIVYLFFNHGKKVLKKGKTVCFVSLTIKQLKIKRTNKPNLVEIMFLDIDNIIYGDEAQSYILHHITKIDLYKFLLSSYYQQCNNIDVLNVPPCQQLNILKSISLEDVDNEEHKKYVKDKIYKLSIDKKSQECLLPNIEKLINIKEYKPYFADMINFDITHTTNELEKLINKKYEYEKEYKLIFDKLILHKKDYIDIERCKIEIENINGIRDNLPLYPIDTDIIKLKINTLIHIISTIDKQHEYYHLCDEIEYKMNIENKYKNDAIKENKKYIENIDIWIEREDKEKKYNKCVEYINEIKSYLKIVNLKSDDVLQSCITLHEEVNKYLRSSVIPVNCPSCNIKLNIYRNELTIADTTDNIVLDKTYLEYVDKIDIAKVKNNIEYIRCNEKSIYKNSSYTILEIKNRIKTVSDLENKTYSPELLNLIERKNLYNISHDDVQYCTSDKDKYSMELDKLKEKYNDNLYIISQHKILDKKIEKYKYNISILVEYQEDEKNISILSDKIKLIQSEIYDMKESIYRFHEYTDYVKYLDLITQKKECIDKISELTDDILGYMELKSAMKNAELESMKSFIHALNVHANIHLCNMFKEEIEVSIDNTFTTIKKEIRHKISTKIFYKGIQFNNGLDELSAGERQRIILCYTLALHEIIGGKYLFLDECLNNLDEDTNSETLKYISSVTSGNLVLVISHESIEGIFDEVIYM